MNSHDEENGCVDLPFLPKSRYEKCHDVSLWWFEREFSQIHYGEFAHRGRNSCTLICVLTLVYIVDDSIQVHSKNGKIPYDLLIAFAKAIINGNFIYNSLLRQVRMSDKNLNIPEVFEAVRPQVASLKEWVKFLEHRIFLLSVMVYKQIAIAKLTNALSEALEIWQYLNNGKDYLFVILIAESRSILLCIEKRSRTVSAFDSHQHSSENGAVLAQTHWDNMRKFCGGILLNRVGIFGMGQTLSEPITAKESSYCQNEFFKVGASCMQGWRVSMEDSHTHVLSLPDDHQTAFFAVYDGHGGSSVAEYAGKHLHKFIVKRPEYKSDIELAMKMAYLDMDHAMLLDESWREQMAGSTAVSILIKENKVYCANAGDSRSVACISGKTDVLSTDHKPNNAKEIKRINDGGGYVEFNRVNGNLALSRALGDFVFKKNYCKQPEEQIVTAYPDVEVRHLTKDWEFIVLACDGIWDVMSNDDVIQFCRKRIGTGMLPEQICEELMTHCLAPDCQMGGLGGDNMTVILVCVLHGQSYNELVEKCADTIK